MNIILNVFRWIIAAVMWIMALSALSFGGLGIVGAILFVIVGIMISPLSSKYIFPKLPMLKKSHKISSVAVIWLAANVFLGLSPAATRSNNVDEARSSAAVSEASVENVERSMADVSTVEASEEDKAVAEASTEALSNSSSEETSKKSSSTEANTSTTKTTSVASTSSTTASATTEATVDQQTAEETATQQAAKEAATQQAAEEAAAQQAAEEAAAQQAAEEAAAQQAAEEAAAQQAAEEAVAQQLDSSTVANGTENANALAVLQMGPTTGDVCWVPRNGGTKYHTSSTCSGMDDPIRTTVDTAEACGFEPCKRCH